MSYGICNLAVIPIRKEPGHSSEMVSQLLFNELYEVIDEKPEWVHIVSSSDRYEGWIQAKQHLEISEGEFNSLNGKTPYFTQKPVIEHEGKFLSMGTPLYEPHPEAAAMPSEFHPEVMLKQAKMLLDAPYLWGGRTVFGIDCSGFVQLCAKMAGKMLPRDASQQMKEGELVYFLPEIQPGDLAFFGNEEGKIVHVGMMLDSEHIIHASGQVRIDYLDQTGIFNKERNEHTHRLQVIKRI